MRLLPAAGRALFAAWFRIRSPHGPEFVPAAANRCAQKRPRWKPGPGKIARERSHRSENQSRRFPPPVREFVDNGNGLVSRALPFVSVRRVITARRARAERRIGRLTLPLSLLAWDRTA